MASLCSALRCSIHTISNCFICFISTSISCHLTNGSLPGCPRLQGRQSCTVMAAKFPLQRFMRMTECCCQGTLPLRSSTRHTSRVNLKKGRPEERLGSSEYEAAEWVGRIVKDPMVEVDPFTIRQQISAARDGAIVVAPSEVSSSSGPPSVAGSGNGNAILATSAAFVVAAMVAVVQSLMSRPSRSKGVGDIWSTRDTLPELASVVSDQTATNHVTADSTEECTAETKVLAEFEAPPSGGLSDQALDSLTMGSNKVEAFIARNTMDMGLVASQEGMSETPVILVGHKSSPSISKPYSDRSATNHRGSAGGPPSLSTTKVAGLPYGNPVNSFDSQVANQSSRVLEVERLPSRKVFLPPSIPKVGEMPIRADDPANPSYKKNKQDERESLHQALQAAMPIITIGGGAGGVLAGVDGSLELVGLIATISFIWYELLWAKRRNQLWAEVSAVRDHRTLANFFKSKQGTTNG